MLRRGIGPAILIGRTSVVGLRMHEKSRGKPLTVRAVSVCRSSNPILRQKQIGTSRLAGPIEDAARPKSLEARLDPEDRGSRRFHRRSDSLAGRVEPSPPVSRPPIQRLGFWLLSFVRPTRIHLILDAIRCATERVV